MAFSLDRRAVLLAGSAGLALPQLLTAPAEAAALDVHTRTWLRLVADLSGRPRVTVLRGDVWGFKPQADDLTVEAFAKRLYGYWSLAVRRTDTRADGSIALTTKGWSFYLDPLTGEPVDQLPNPYTAERVAAPPLSGPAFTRVYPVATTAGERLDITERRMAERAWVQVSRISRFKPADVSWYKLEADLSSYACRAADLDDPRLTAVPNTWSHNLVAEWQTWMRMHGTPGHILFKGDGAEVASLDAAPAALLAAIDQRFPGSRAEVARW